MEGIQDWVIANKDVQCENDEHKSECHNGYFLYIWLLFLTPF